MTTLRYAVGVMFLTLLLVPNEKKPLPSWITTITSIRHAVVPVVCGYTNEQGEYVIADIEGTGFFIDREGRFVTAAHVLTGLTQFSQTKHRCSPAVYIPDAGWDRFTMHIHIQYFNFVTCISSVSDIAVCKCIENPFTSARITAGSVQGVTFDPSELRDGTPVAFTGFPLQYPSPITAIGIIAGRVAMADSDAFFYYAVDKPSWPGASGSPLFTEDGKVVGIILRGGRDLGAGLGYAETSAAIIDSIGKAAQSEQPKK